MKLPQRSAPRVATYSMLFLSEVGSDDNIRILIQLTAVVYEKHRVKVCDKEKNHIVWSSKISFYMSD